ncbi:MAG: glucosaminidase domain-containing protein [Paludibacteraceae bacterium]|nr:glucosaminidase domain-containing protein [Paludibacteraceae bacterium]
MSGRFLVSFVFFCCGISLSAQVSYRSAETIEYIERFHRTAIREMYLYNIPASITLAQGILESGSGRSPLAVSANNHFGIKCTDDYKGKRYHQDDDRRHECFRVYANPEQSFRDHSLFLLRPHYADLFKLRITDYKGWAKGLKKAGYATNPKYPDLLIEVIEQNYLDIYDRNPEKFLSRDGSLDDSPSVRKSEPRKQPEKKPSKDVSPKGTDKPSADGGFERINGLKCVRVKHGDTFYSLSKRAGISVDKLRAYNDFPSNYVLKSGEYVFFQPKKRAASKATVHRVVKGDTWLSVSQKYGVRLDDLKKMNRKVPFRVGAKLRLK